MQRKTRTALVSGGVVLTLAIGAAADTPNVAALVTQANKDMKRVEELWKTATKEKDMIRINCINLKLTNLRGLVRVLEIAVANEKEAAERSDNEARTHESGRIAIAVAQIKAGVAQAQACRGEVSRYTGPVEVKTEVDPLQTGGSSFVDPVATTFLVVPELLRPNSASPYQ